MRPSHPAALMLAAAAFAAAAPSALAQSDLPVLELTRDDTVITRSCRVVIPAGTIIADTNNNGVIQIRTDDVEVVFEEGSVLRGRAQTDIEREGWDTLEGLAIRIEGAEGVTVRDAVVRGYRVGLHATETDKLTLHGIDVADVYRKRLGSTPVREDSGDWMSPHRNDNNEWLTRYAAAVYIEDAQDVTVREARVRRGQHGIVLDRVEHSRIYDNDASFLSGWGLALWRSSDNLISRNAFDFCVRGHVEGVYNRGQDSAGILFFEQCNRNTVVENSATHGGDAFFGFGGLDALGSDEYAQTTKDRERLGCNDNVFLRNDLSYAPAHGWEMTFSFGNVFAHNRAVENAICGIWGGFSQETVVFGNHFEANGGMAYGLERGAINIEHGANNLFAENDFVDNRVGLHLWTDDPGNIDETDWGAANYKGMVGNAVFDNTFVRTNEQRPFWSGRNRPASPDEARPLIQIRCIESMPVEPTLWFANEVAVRGSISTEQLMRIECPTGLDRTPSNAQQRALRERLSQAKARVAGVEPIGSSRPVTIGADGIPRSARAELAGRENIIMDEWGPWNHTGQLVRTYQKTADEHGVLVHGLGDDQRLVVVASQPGGDRIDLTARGGSGSAQSDALALEVRPTDSGAMLVLLRPRTDGVQPYTLQIQTPEGTQTIDGTFVGVDWQAKAWSWNANPLEDLDAWRRESERAQSFAFDSIDFPFGWGGLASVQTLDEQTRSAVREAGIGNDRFGLVARTRARFDPGRYRIRTTSDDGVRVFIDGRKVIERWDIHVPTPDAAEFTVDDAGPTEILIEYFENEGAAELTVDFERLD